MSAIAITTGPGLAPCLRAGLEYAKTISREYNVPIIAVNHLEVIMIKAFFRMSIDVFHLGSCISSIPRCKKQADQTGSKMTVNILEKNKISLSLLGTFNIWWTLYNDRSQIQGQIH